MGKSLVSWNDNEKSNQLVCSESHCCTMLSPTPSCTVPSLVLGSARIKYTLGHASTPLFSIDSFYTPLKLISQLVSHNIAGALVLQLGHSLKIKCLSVAAKRLMTFFV